jgi:hypothetical protein
MPHLKHCLFSSTPLFPSPLLVRHYALRGQPKDPREVYIDVEEVIRQSKSSSRSDNTKENNTDSNNTNDNSKEKTTTTSQSLKNKFQHSELWLALIAAFLAVNLAFRLLRARHRYEEDVEYMKEAILFLEEALNGASPSESSTNSDSSSPTAQSLSQRLNEIRSTKQQLTTLLSSVTNTPTSINQNKSSVSKTIDQNITAKEVKISDLSEIFEILYKTERILSREEKVMTYQQQALERLAALQRERKHLWTFKKSEVQSTTSSSSPSPSTAPTSTSTSTSQDSESEGRVF